MARGRTRRSRPEMLLRSECYWLREFDADELAVDLLVVGQQKAPSLNHDLPPNDGEST